MVGNGSSRSKPFSRGFRPGEKDLTLAEGHGLIGLKYYHGTAVIGCPYAIGCLAPGGGRAARRHQFGDRSIGCPLNCRFPCFVRFAYHRLRSAACLRIPTSRNNNKLKPTVLYTLPVAGGLEIDLILLLFSAKFVNDANSSHEEFPPLCCKI